MPALKGIHYAIRSGMLAAESAVEAVGPGSTAWTPGGLESYDEAIRESFIWKDLKKVRNMRPAFTRGFVSGSALAGVATVSFGKFPPKDLDVHADAEAPVSLDRERAYPAPDGVLTFDKLSSVFLSGNKTRDDAPDHIRVQHEVPRELAETWVRMCPAQVYEIVEDAAASDLVSGRGDRLELRAVRRDHRQGRPADAARGRRRAGLHPDVSACRGCRRPTMSSAQPGGSATASTGRPRSPPPPSAPPPARAVYLKAELLQRTGSFKPRGVFTRLDALTAGRAATRGDRRLGGQPRPGARLCVRDGRGIDCLVVMWRGASAPEGRSGARLRRDRRPRGAGAGGGVRPARRAHGATGRSSSTRSTTRSSIAGQGTVGLELARGCA